MSIHDIWQHYQTGGYARARHIAPMDALGSFYLALIAFGEDDFAGALAFVHQAAWLQPDNLVFQEAAIYLDRVVQHGKAGVYVDGAAFAAFIRGGGNVGLYTATSAALQAVYADYHTLSLLDIGVGDGMALLPALTEHVTRLDLVEPSAAMLARATADLARRGIPYQAANMTLQDFMAARPDRAWDVTQATYSLQSIPPAERPAAFRWMRAHTQRLLIAEFDVPDLADPYAPERVIYIVEHYQRGLAEYVGDGGQVAQGFLIPVLFGYFDRTAARTNWEGPISAWADSLRAAGFQTVQTRKLYEYFWADAYLIDARSR